MIIYYVAGGSYKSFYLNNINKIKKCDLIIFNYGIFYDIVNRKDYSIVIEEIKSLSKRLKCKVLVGVRLIKNNKFYMKILLTNGKVCGLYNLYFGFNFKLKNKKVYVGINSKIYTSDIKVVFSKNKINPNCKACSKLKTYLFCDRFGVSYIQNKKIKRNFQKCSKIILK